MPKLYIISGCNGSGKTTASYSLLPELFGCCDFVNSDEFAKTLSPFHPEAAAISASRLMIKKIRILLSKKKDFCIETTLATRSLPNLIRQAQEQGYFVTILYLWLSSPELALARIKARVKAGGHHIEEETVRRRYWVGLNLLFREYMPLCDHWILADNSRIPFSVVAEGGKDGTTINNPARFNTIQTMHTKFEKRQAALLKTSRNQDSSSK